MTIPKATRRKAYIQYQLSIRGKTLRDVAQEAKTTPTSVSRIIAGNRPNGAHAPNVWRAISKITRIPQEKLQDPPRLVDDPEHAVSTWVG